MTWGKRDICEGGPYKRTDTYRESHPPFFIQDTVMGATIATSNKSAEWYKASRGHRWVKAACL